LPTTSATRFSANARDTQGTQRLKDAINAEQHNACHRDAVIMDNPSRSLNPLRCRGLAAAAEVTAMKDGDRDQCFLGR
jgi:hypothetical protein